MSAMGDLRTRLEEIHEMLPLSNREQGLAGMVLWGDGECEMEASMRADAKWWGEKALVAARAIGADV